MNFALLFFLSRGWYFGPSFELDGTAIWPIVAQQRAKWRQTNSSMSCWRRKHTARKSSARHRCLCAVLTVRTSRTTCKSTVNDSLHWQWEAKPDSMDAVRGKSLTADQIYTLDDSKVESFYARNEARLGAVMTKTLGSAALQLYAVVASLFLPIPVENQPWLIADLEGDPFVGHALSMNVCELYRCFGMFLAPVTAVLTTMKYAQFGHQCPRTINDIDDESGGFVQRGGVAGGSD